MRRANMAFHRRRLLQAGVYAAAVPVALEAGVDGMFTNHPDRLRKLLDASLSKNQSAFD